MDWNHDYQFLYLSNILEYAVERFQKENLPLSNFLGNHEARARAKTGPGV